MKIPKTLSLFNSWALLLFLLQSFIPELGSIIEWRTLLFVLAIPPFFAFAVLGGPDVLCALRWGVGLGDDELPSECRQRYVGTLRLIGDLSLGAGVFAFFATVIATFNVLAASAGQASPLEVVAGASTTFLAPLYGFLLRSFVYGPMAAGLDQPGSWLGVTLESDTESHTSG